MLSLRITEACLNDIGRRSLSSMLLEFSPHIRPHAIPAQRNFQPGYTGCGRETHNWRAPRSASAGQGTRMRDDSIEPIERLLPVGIPLMRQQAKFRIELGHVV